MKGSRISDQGNNQNYTGSSSNTTTMKVGSAKFNTERPAEAMDTQEPSRSLHSSSIQYSHSRNLHEFVPRGRGIGQAIGHGRGRGLTYDCESPARNPVSRGAWRDGDSLEEEETDIISQSKKPVYGKV